MEMTKGIGEGFGTGGDPGINNKPGGMVIVALSPSLMTGKSTNGTNRLAMTFADVGLITPINGTPGICTKDPKVIP
jgi:hypothetical protein